MKFILTCRRPVPGAEGRHLQEPLSAWLANRTANRGLCARGSLQRRETILGRQGDFKLSCESLLAQNCISEASLLQKIFFSSVVDLDHLRWHQGPGRFAASPLCCTKRKQACLQRHRNGTHGCRRAFRTLPKPPPAPELPARPLGVAAEVFWRSFELMDTKYRVPTGLQTLLLTKCNRPGSNQINR